MNEALSPLAGVTQLGERVSAAHDPDSAILETVPRRPSDRRRDYVVRLTAPEFTSLCPVTGQPDFATIIVDYVPAHRLIESKSWKLLLGSFRNHGMFHEDIADYLGNRILDVATPVWARVAAFFYPRGGIPIDVFWQTGAVDDMWCVQPLNIPMFRGR